jgi:hypothetical protein
VHGRNFSKTSDKTVSFGTVNNELGSSVQIVFYFGLQDHRFHSNSWHAVGFFLVELQIKNCYLLTYLLASLKDVKATGEAFSPQKRTTSTSKR